MSTRINRLAWQLVIVIAWLWTFVHLSAEWRANEQYEFGFGVPFLAAWIAWRRRDGAMQPGSGNFMFWSALALGLLALALGTLLHWHDPLWRLTGALLAAGAALLTGAWFFRLGGTSLLRREIFPLCFAAFAIPWPMPLELPITQHLAALVTDISATLVNAFGIAALQRGNVIELANGLVGVNEACSGIQSLQAMLMTSVFLGEFFVLSVARRLVLVIVGIAISLSTNCLRVLALTLITHRHGESAAAAWHDGVGLTATMIAFASLLVVAKGFAGTVASASGIVLNSGKQPDLREGRCVLFSIVAIIFSTWTWFSQLGKNDASPLRQQWTLNDASMPAGWSAEFVPPSPGLRSGLRFSEWQAFRIRDPAGVASEIIRLAWKSGTRMPAFVTSHTPAVCMPSAGWVQIGSPFLLTPEIHGAELPCVAYAFTRDGDRILALQSLSAGGHIELRLVDPAQIPGGFRRLATLWQAPLRQITEELLLYIADPGDPAARKEAATKILGAILVSGAR
ncbi:MAG: exosortase/archaeosortase family protein [Chthoniobacteraceae bacterium]